MCYDSNVGLSAAESLIQNTICSIDRCWTRISSSEAPRSATVPPPCCSYKLCTIIMTAAVLIGDHRHVICATVVVVAGTAMNESNYKLTSWIFISIYLCGDCRSRVPCFYF